MLTAIKKKLLSDGAWASGGRIITALSMFLVNIVLTRLLDPNEVGAFLLTVNIVNFAAIVGSFGVKQAVIKFVGESLGWHDHARARDVVKKILWVSAFGAMSCAVLYFFLGAVIAERLLKSNNLAGATIIVSVWILVLTGQKVIPEIFRAFHNLRLASIFDGALPWAMVLLGVSSGLLLRDHLDFTFNTVVEIGVGVSFFSLCFSALFLFLMLRRYSAGKALKSVSLSELFGVSLSQWVTSITIFFTTQADMWIIAAYLGEGDVALYGVAAKLTNIVVLQLVIVNLVVQPVIARMYAEGIVKQLERILQVTATIVGGPALLIFIVFLIWGDNVLALAFGGYYRAAAVVLGILSIGKAFHIWAGSCGLLLNMTGHHRPAMFFSIASALITIALSLGTVSRFGIIGVAVATSLGYLLVNGAMVLYSVKILGIRTYMLFPGWPLDFPIRNRR